MRRAHPLPVVGDEGGGRGEAREVEPPMQHGGAPAVLAPQLLPSGVRHRASIRAVVAAGSYMWGGQMPLGAASPGASACH